MTQHKSLGQDKHFTQEDNKAVMTYLTSFTVLVKTITRHIFLST